MAAKPIENRRHAQRRAWLDVECALQNGHTVFIWFNNSSTCARLEIVHGDIDICYGAMFATVPGDAVFELGSNACEDDDIPSRFFDIRNLEDYSKYVSFYGHISELLIE